MGSLLSEGQASHTLNLCKAVPNSTSQTTHLKKTANPTEVLHQRCVSGAGKLLRGFWGAGDWPLGRRHGARGHTEDSLASPHAPEREGTSLGQPAPQRVRGVRQSLHSAGGPGSRLQPLSPVPKSQPPLDTDTHVGKYPTLSGRELRLQGPPKLTPHAAASQGR